MESEITETALFGVAILVGAVIFVYPFYYARWINKKTELRRTLEEIQKRGISIEGMHPSEKFEE